MNIPLSKVNENVQFSTMRTFIDFSAFVLYHKYINRSIERVLFMNFSVYQIIVQALGVIGIIASVLSFQCKKHGKLLFLRTANEFFFGIQYFLLGAYTGMAMNLIGCVRNLIFVDMVKKNKNTIPARIAFSVLFLAGTLITWSGMKSILIGAAKVISTFAYGSSNTFVVRIMVFITSSSWLAYNLMVKSYAGCVCEMLTLCSIIAGIIRIDIPSIVKKNTEN